MQQSTRTKWVAARSSNTKPPLRHFTQPDHCLLRWCWTGHMMDIPQILLKVQLILLPVSAPFRKHALGSAGHQSWVPLSVPLEVQLTRTSISLSSQKLPSGPNLDSAYGLPTSSKYLSLDGAWMGRRLVPGCVFCLWLSLPVTTFSLLAQTCLTSLAGTFASGKLSLWLTSLIPIQKQLLRTYYVPSTLDVLEVCLGQVEHVSSVIPEVTAWQLLPGVRSWNISTEQHPFYLLTFNIA